MPDASSGGSTAAPRPVTGVATVQKWRARLPGVLAAFTVAAAASFLSKEYGAPAMLMALLLGLAFNFVYQDTKAADGVDYAAKQVLRAGVALLGLRITTDALAGLGLLPIILILGSVVATILIGAVLARMLGLKAKFGFLTGGAVGICGASAALALSSVLPRTKAQEEELERDTLLAVVGVTALSTLAMVTYPLIASALGYTSQETGLFFGATIHDVAQVVGAGYGVSMETGDTATITKLMRVTLLLPAAIAFLVIGRMVAARGAKSRGASGTQLVPVFLVVFTILMVVNSLGYVPDAVSAGATKISGFFLVAAIAAIGMKTSLRQMFELGPRPMMLIGAETVVIALIVILTISYGDLFMSRVDALNIDLAIPPINTHIPGVDTHIEP